MGEPPYPYPTSNNNLPLSIHAFGCAIRLLLGEKRSRSWNYGLWSDANVKATESTFFCRKKNRGPPLPSLSNDQSPRRTCMKEEAETPSMHVLVKPSSHSPSPSESSHNKREIVSVIVEFLLNAENFEMEKLLGELLTTNCNAHDCEDHVHVCDGVVCGETRSANTTKADECTDEIECVDNEAKVSFEQCCWSTFLRRVQETAFFSGGQAQLDEVRGAPATSHASNRLAVNENGGRRSRIPRNKLAPSYTASASFASLMTSSSSPQNPTFGGFTAAPATSVPPSSAVLLNPLSDIFFISPFLASIFPALTNCFLLNEVARDHHHHHPEESMTEDTTDENLGSGDFPSGEGNGLARGKESSRFEETKNKNKKGCGGKWHGYSFLFDTRVADDLKKIFVENGVIMMECILSHGYDPFHFISNAPQLFIKKFGLAGLRLLFAHGLDPHYTTAEKLEEFGFVDSGREDQKKATSLTSYHLPYQTFVNEKEGEGEEKGECSRTLFSTSLRLGNSFLSFTLPFPIENGKGGEEKEPNHSSQLSSQGTQSHNSTTMSERIKVLLRHAAHQYIICSVLFSSYCRERNHFAVLMRSAAEAGCAPPMAHQTYASEYASHPSVAPLTTAYPFSTIHYTNDLPPPTATLLHACADLCLSEPFSKFAAGALPNKLHLRLPLPPALGGDEASSTLSSAVSSLDNYKGEEENDCTFIPSFSSSSSACASATSSSAYPYISEKDPLASLLLILGEGADPDSKDSFLRTPLHLAKSSEAVFALFASGAAINAVDFLGNNAFHLVVSKDNRLCLSCALATCGCDLGAINIRGWTPFMEAVLKCSAPDLALTVRSEQIIELWRRIRLGPRHMRFLAPHFSSVLENLLRRCHSLPTSDMHGNEGVRLKLESQMHQGGHSTLLKKKQELENAERASTNSLTPRGEPNDVTHASTLSIGPLADHKNNFTIAHALVLRLINNGDSGNIVISSFLKRCLTPLPSTTTASNINSKVSSPSSSSCFSSSSCAFPNSNTAAFLSLSFTLSSSDSIALQTELTTSDVRIDLDDGITQHPFRVRRELQAKTKTIGGRNGISVNSSDNTGTNSSAFTLTLRKKSSPLHLAALINAIDAIKPIVTAICAAAATTGGTYNTATTTSTTTLPDVDRDDDEDDAQEHEHVMKGKEEEINERQKRRGLSQHSIPTVLGLVDEDGRTCLHVAAERGHDAFIHLLLTESFTLNLLTYACAQCAGPAKYASLLGKCLSGEKTHQGEAVEKSHRRFVSPSDITCDALGEMRCGVGTAAATVHVASSSTGGSKEALHHICRAKTVAKGCGLNGLSSSSSSSSAAFSSSSRSSPPDLANTNEDYDVSHTKSTEGSEGKKNVGHTQQQQQRSDRRRVARSPFAGVPRCAANAHLYDSSSSSTSDDDRGTIRTRGTARAKAGGQPQPNPLLRRPRGVVSLSSSSDSDDLCDPPLLGNRLLFVPPTSSLSSPLCANAPSFILSSCPRANDSVIVEKDNDNDEVAAEVAMQETKARLPLLRVVEARDANGETAADIAMRGLAQLVDEYRLAEEAPVGSTNGGRLNSAFSVLTLSLYSSSSSSSSSEDTTDDEGGKEEEERHLHGKQWRTTAAQSTFKTDSTTTVDSSADPNSSNCTSHSMMRRRRRWIKKLKRAFADRALAYLRIVFTLRTFARDKKDEEKNPLGTPKREGGASGTHTVVGNDRGLLPHIIASAAEKIIGMKTNQKATSLFSQLRTVLGPPDIDGTTFLTRSDALAFLEEARRLLRISRNDSNKREGTGSSTFTCTHPTTHSIIPQQPQPQKKSDICSEATSTANTTLIRRMVVANACKRSRGDANESGEGRPHRQVLPSASSSSSICQHNVVSCCCATCESDDDGNESRSKRHISESKKHFA